MMNEGVVQSSVPVQQMVPAGGPNWRCINNMRPPPHHQHRSLLPEPPAQNHDLQLMPPLIASPSSWTDQELQLPEPWSQLHLGGLVSEEDYKSGSIIKLEKWEQHLQNQSSDTCAVRPVIIKQEKATTYEAAGTDHVEIFQAPKSTNSWSASSPTSCITNILDFSHKSSECNSSGSTGGAAKKARTQTSSFAQSDIKVRKEKLGDRITALHQLVSPFGKTDTASVLLEVIGYIRFLHNQIEALSLPYLGSSTPSGNIRPQQHLLIEKYIKRKAIFEQESCDEEPNKDLKSRGLCLVPISCTVDVGSENGGDYWAPAFGANFQ